MSETPVDRAAVPEQPSDEGRRQLRMQFATTDLPRHLALFYRTRSEQMRVVTTYVTHGIRQDERVVYIADENDTGTVADALAVAGLDVEELQRDGQLRLLDAAEVYADASFDPEGSVDVLRELAEAAVADGYDGLRVAGENSWSFGLDCPFDDVVEFEHNFDETCPDLPVTALCQYSLEQFTDDKIGLALQTHKRIIYRETLCANPYYVPPDEAVEYGTGLSNAALLLEQTRDVHQFREDIERREERLSVVNRVLRHNLRNELNVIRGRLDWLEREGLVEAAATDHVEAVRAAARRLLDLSENAKYVDRTLEGGEGSPRAIDEIVTAAVEDATCDHPDLSVTVASDPPSDTAAPGTVRRSLRELLSSAASRLPGPEVEVHVDADERYETATIEVVADEGFVSEATMTAFDNDSEQALAHASDLRLWVAQWTIQSLNGRLELAGPPPADRARLSFPTVSERVTASDGD